jgi:hypothetical protein
MAGASGYEGGQSIFDDHVREVQASDAGVGERD